MSQSLPGRMAAGAMRILAATGIAATLSASPAGATETTYVLQNGTFGSSELYCHQIAWLFSGQSCDYGRNRSSTYGTWLGPFFAAGHYTRGSAADSPAYTPAPGDGKYEAPVTGTLTLDDNGTPGYYWDDQVGMTLVIGAMSRNAATGQSTRAVQSWNAMTHTVAKGTVSSAVANASGGIDYIIGSDGFPDRLCKEGSSADADCFPTDQGPINWNVPRFWGDIAPYSIGIERAEVHGGNIGFTSTATFDETYTCVASDPNSGNCTNSTVVWGAGEDAGFDNIVARIRTDAQGNITSAFLYWTQEYLIAVGSYPPGDNSTSMGTIEFSAQAPSIVRDAQDDAFSVEQGSSANSLNVTANDSGFGQTVTVTVGTPPAHGTAIVTGSPGNRALVRIQYTPLPGYNGPDSFTYSIDDGVGSDTATVTMTVLPPDAKNDVAVTAVGLPATIDALANDEGFSDPVTVTILDGPDHGLATVAGSPGNAAAVRISYTPAGGYFGPDSITYQVTDGVATDTATIAITVLSYRAVDDHYYVLRDNCCQYLYIGANDIGFGSPATTTILEFPNKGGYISNYNNNTNPSQIYYYYQSYPYDKPDDYTETFKYQITDGTRAGTAYVRIEVVRYAAVPDSASTSKDVPVSIQVRNNDIGFNYVSTVGIVTNPLHGTAAVVGSPGSSPSVTYTPAPGFTGTDTFEYGIDDGTRVDTALVTVQIIVDADSDLVDDGVDNCLGFANASQKDGDGDGYGNRCDADLNQDGRVNFGDLAIFRTRFATSDATADFDGSGTVNFADLSILQSLFGKSPGPSALAP